MTITVDILLESPLWGGEDDWRKTIEAAVTAAAARADAEIVEDAELSVVLSDDAAIRVINRDHRGFDKATNVLSFPQDEADADAYGPLLGDIVVAFETVAQEARLGGLPLAHHLTHMIVHGFLHLVGYDHMNDAEADEMEELESAILADLGVPDPYADPPATGDGH